MTPTTFPVLARDAAANWWRREKSMDDGICLHIAPYGTDRNTKNISSHRVHKMWYPYCNIMLVPTKREKKKIDDLLTTHKKNPTEKQKSDWLVKMVKKLIRQKKADQAEKGLKCIKKLMQIRDTQVVSIQSQRYPYAINQNIFIIDRHAQTSSRQDMTWQFFSTFWATPTWSQTATGSPKTSTWQSWACPPPPKESHHLGQWREKSGRENYWIIEQDRQLVRAFFGEVDHVGKLHHHQPLHGWREELVTYTYI